MTPATWRPGEGSQPPSPRIPRLRGRESLDEAGRSAFDRIVGSRGTLLRPFEILLHAPAMAERVAELGDVVRFGSHLPDAIREVATLATGRAHGCAFVWASHLEAARSAGVPAAAIERLERGERLDGGAAAIVAFVDELCETSSVSDVTFAAVLDVVGTRGVTELVVTVGYYTMLSFAMRVTGAC